MARHRNTGSEAEAELPEYAGHYRLESRLGSGGMGVVHLARSTSGLKLAVKVVHAELAKDREFRDRFRQEVAAARKVSGAFTAPVVDADPEADRPWMATLFIPGPTLADHVKRNGAMPPARLRLLMAGLAEALRDIHRAGVVHRDLKPSNVLLADDGSKVIDFGISRPNDSELRTETGKLIGTPPFMAPEQFRRPREVGPAADIFALGSVMVHAATGRGPFGSDSPYIVAYQVVHDEPDLTGVPGDLAPLLLRCLAKEPEERPTPDEIVRELRSMAASYDTQAFVPVRWEGDAPHQESPKESPQESAAESGAQAAPDAGEPGGARTPRRLRRRAALAAGAVAVVLGGVFGSVQWLGDHDRTPMPAAKDVGDTAAAFHPWQAKAVRKGADMPQCVYGAEALLCYRSGLAYALDAADGSVRWRRPLSDERVSSAPALAGGLLVVPADGGSRVVALDPASGRTRWTWHVPVSGLMVAAGDMVLAADSDGSVTGFSTATARTKWKHRPAAPEFPYLATFAGDPLVYATTVSAGGTHTRVTALDPASGDVRWTARLAGDLNPVGSSDGSLVLLSTNWATGNTTAIVRYTPGSKSSRRIALPIARSAPQAGVHGGIVHLFSDGGALEAFDLTTGRRLWLLETSVTNASIPAADRSHVYITAADGRLLAADARSGHLLGQTTPRLATDSDTLPATMPTPLVAHGHVYGAGPDGSMIAVDGRDPSAW
ncbi:serine/threonine-protein kinase [Streptomyces sp. NPDC086787]|uniref:serine/threonine-protein kinase n=1 Tax=Streptomyces sp. NPDC086787 TaxID=3365759 RepID=UPI00381B9788